MDEPEPLFAFFGAQDALFERVEPAWWGAVVSDARFPAVQEANYARVETAEPVGLAEIEAAMLPALAGTRSRRSHVVVFRPDEQTDLIAEASTRGDRITFDLVMVIDPAAATPAAVADQLVSIDEAFWSEHRASLRLFDIHDEDALDQLQAIERDLTVPAGRRWFVRRGGGRDARPDALAALLVLEGVGYLDHVVTFPEVRGRGHAEALTRTAVAEAAGMGAERVYLLAEPGSPAVRIYERVGFERAGHLASWLSRRV
ncbi:MAG: GNAT family N-acetyltransferase [Actinobacteria bacterium]|nr:GNAT family N-acetyltransferase [Actinomycetota bacterium]